MGFIQGLSGLNTSSRALDVISNNIANASTVGYKASNTIFADVYAGALTGVSSAIQIGYGSKVTAVYQNFQDGTPTTTNNPLDMAIIGNGFYVIQRTDGSIAYSRNGQFDISKEGFIITPLGEKLLGILADANGVIPPSGGASEPIFVDLSVQDPKATTEVEIRSGNLNADDALPIVTAFDPSDLDSYNFMHTIPVYDSLGGQHTLAMYFVKTSAGNWDIYEMLDGDITTLSPPLGSPPAARMSIGFDAYGKLSTVNGVPVPSGTTVQIPYTATLTNSAAALNIDIDITKLTQFGAKSSVYDHGQDGHTVGQLTGIVVNQDGIVQGRYTNGEAKNLGQIVLATFRSNQGLTSVGDNLWIESPESGPPIIGRPRSGLNGQISGGQVEESNVDLTQELVNMIIQQRNYQANSQTIRTQDQILQTLVNLR
ncbi:MAG: flagellar hook protein FlgE [Azoarcus sp.]|jgi:flagellar hook protein FlgE|nr:flagellar hook protein FlgE [Azoarcus sp.]